MTKIKLIHVSEPLVADDESIRVDIKAALYKEHAGDPEAGIKIPHVSFKIHSAVASTAVISDNDGIAEVKNFKIDGGPFEIIASDIEGDEPMNVVERVSIDVRTQLAKIEDAQQKRKRAEEKRAAKEAERQAQEEAQRQREKLAQERYEASGPERKRQIKEDITRAGENIKRRERLQVDPFNVLREHAADPHAKRTALMVAEEAPERTIEAIEIYKTAGWAFEAMKIAAAKEPMRAVAVVERYKNMEWAPEILKIAANRHGHEVVAALPHYCDYPWCKDVVMHVAEIHPQAVFEKVSMWEFYPWAEEAAMHAAKKAPEFAMNNFRLYQDRSWAERLYKSVAVGTNIDDVSQAEMKRLLKKKIEKMGSELQTTKSFGEGEKEKFAFLFEHRFHPHTIAIVPLIVEKAPDICLQAVTIYKSAPWAREMVLAAAKKRPQTALQCLEEYIEMQWAEEVMRVVSGCNPLETIRNLYKYAKYKWSKGIVRQIAEVSPETIFKEMENIEYYPWAEEIVEVAAQKNSAKALELQFGFREQSWAVGIVERIEQRKLEQVRAAKQLADFEEQNRQLRMRETALQINREREAREKTEESRRKAEQRAARLATEQAKEQQRVEQQEKMEREKREQLERSIRENELPNARRRRRRLVWGFVAIAGLMGGALGLEEVINDYSAEKAAAEQEAAEKAAAEQEAARIAAEKVAAEQEAARIAAEKAAAEQEAARIAAEKVAAEQEAVRIAAEEKKAAALRKWYSQGDSKILAALKTLAAENNKGLNIPGLDNLFLFKADGGKYTLRLLCNDLESAMCDFLKKTSFPGIVSNTADQGEHTVITYSFEAAQDINEQIKEFIYLMEAFAQVKKGSSEYIRYIYISGLGGDLRKVKYSKRDLHNASCGSFDAIFPEMAAKNSNYSDEQTFILPDDLYFLRDLITFEKLLNKPNLYFQDFREKVGAGEAQRYFSSIQSVADFEILLKHFRKVKEGYTIIGDIQINLTPSLVTEIAKKLTEYSGGSKAGPTPCVGAAVVVKKYERDDYHHKGHGMDCYALTHHNGGFVIGNFYFRTSEISQVRLPGGGYGNEEKEVWGEWEENKDHYYRIANRDNAVKYIVELIEMRCHEDSFVGACALNKVSDDNYRVVAYYAESSEILFQYVLHNLESNNSAYKVVGVETDHILVRYSSKGKATVVYKVYTLSNSVLRTEVVSVNGKPINEDIVSEPAWMSTVRGTIKKDLEELIANRIITALTLSGKKVPAQ